jgi:four helix bundle protein
MSKVIATHRDLHVWRESLQLAEIIYRETELFPNREHYGLALQLRRAAVSIPSNVAEGAARSSSKEFAKFLSIARGSLAELDTQIELATRFGYLRDHQAVDAKIELCGRMLSALMASIRRRIGPPK